MAEYVITTENAADLPESFVKENEIGVLSLYYTIDGVTYGPGHEPQMSAEDFYAKMRAGMMPKTQQVNPDQAMETFRSYLKQGKDILHLALTSAVSGSCNSAMMAARELKEEFPERTITVIDTSVLSKTLFELHKHGVNLNQLMKFCNTYGLDAFNESHVIPTLENERTVFLQTKAALLSLEEEARRGNVMVNLELSDDMEEEDS